MNLHAILRPSRQRDTEVTATLALAQRQIAVTEIATASFEMGWKARDARGTAAPLPVPAPRDGWQTHRQCSKCAPCPGNCGCDCHAPVNSVPAEAAA